MAKSEGDQRIIKPGWQADQDYERTHDLTKALLSFFDQVLFNPRSQIPKSPDAPLDMLRLKSRPVIFHSIILDFCFLHYQPLKIQKLDYRHKDKIGNTLHTGINEKYFNDICNLNDSKILTWGFLESHRSGLLSDKDISNNLIGTFLAGHEMPQHAILLLMDLLSTCASYEPSGSNLVT
ncbi:hypothetical protein P3342_001059 [Pyrenophora teres f. teres]|nr:hypothetical protein P3342_001059 [Pyrenophora teres f. teres]